MTRLPLRGTDIGQIVAAIVVIVVMAVALRPQSTVTIPAEHVLSESNRETVADAAPPSVLFIGDSYTAGSGTRELSPSCMAAVKLGWLCHLAAFVGTGYVSGGPSNRFTLDEYSGPSTSYSERIPSLATMFQPDVVVLDGGRNDDFAPKGDVLNAMSSTIADAHRAWPDATIVFERPRYLSRPRDDLGVDDRSVTRLTGTAGTAGSLVVIDPIESFVGTDVAPLIGADGIHPNRRGELRLASAIADALMATGLDRER